MRVEKGARILTVDTMLSREWVYFRDKLSRPEWLTIYTLEFLLEAIRRGEIREALVEDPLTEALEGQMSLYGMEDGRFLTAAEKRREREKNR